MSSSSAPKKEEVKARSIGKYKIYETLGKGGYSWVKKGEDTQTGAIVALKFMNRATDQWALEQAEQVRTEIKSLTKIRHQNVMKLYAYNLSAKYPTNDGKMIKTILLVLEYCPGGELFDILYYAEKLEEGVARTYFHQMIAGLEAVHLAGIAHRDLKPQNLLLDTKFCLKITDFGLSKIIETEQDKIMKTTYVGTRGYQAPELLKNQKYTNACDIFSMGVVLFILLAGYPPFEAAHKTDKWYRPLAVGDKEKFWHVHRGAKIEAKAKDLIENMLAYKPKNRITVEEIKKHPWFEGDTVPAKDLKDKVIERFMQARKNRKKDPKKVEDLAASNHAGGPKRDYKKELENEVPPGVPGGTMLRSITTFYSHLKAYPAIYSINQILEGLKVKTEYDQDTHPFKINCIAKTNINEQEAVYTFSINAFADPTSLHCLLHFQPQKISDSMGWMRWFRNMMETICEYDIFADLRPAIAVDYEKSKKDSEKKSSTENSEKEDPPENEAEKEDAPEAEKEDPEEEEKEKEA